MPMGGSWAAVLPAGLALGAYLAGVLRLRRRSDRWPPGRTVAAVLGVAAMTAPLVPPGAARTEEFVGHVVGHLLLAMLGPLVLVRSAPVTLTLRALPVGGRRRLLAVLHGRCARALTHPVTVVALDLGGMYAFYLTPLFGLAHERPWLHALVHLHMALAGCLLSWWLVGPDPRPRRGSLRSALAVLLAVGVGHDVLAKLMYVHVLPRTAGPPAAVRAGAQVMFYGGDAIDLALAVVLLAGWYARRGRRLRHRRPVPGPAPAGAAP